MFDPTPGADRGRNPAARQSSWLLLNAGTVLFLCLFLPAVESCGDPVYPIEFIQHPFGWPVLLPYGLGLVAAVVAAKRLFFPTSAAHRWHIASIVVGFVCYLAATILYGISMVEDPAIAAVPVVLCLLLVRPAAQIFDRSALLAWRSARALWIGAVACTIHFGLFVALFTVDDSDSGGDRLLVGMWLSLFASLLLAAGGRQLELALDPPPDPAPPPIPPARVTKHR